MHIVLSFLIQVLGGIVGITVYGIIAITIGLVSLYLAGYLMEFVGGEWVVLPVMLISAFFLYKSFRWWFSWLDRFIEKHDLKS